MTSWRPAANRVRGWNSGGETERKGWVPLGGTAVGSDAPRSSPEAEHRRLMKNPTERKYSLVSTAFTAGPKDVGRLTTASRLESRDLLSSFVFLDSLRTRVRYPRTDCGVTPRNLLDLDFFPNRNGGYPRKI